MKLRERCQRKVVVLAAHAPLAEAAALMRDAHVGTLVLVDDEGRAVGIVSDRDLVVRGLAQPSPGFERVPVSTVMTTEIVCAELDEDLDVVLRRMSKAGVRRAPVLDDSGRPTAILSVDEIIGWLSEELALVHHIYGRQRGAEWQRHPDRHADGPLAKASPQPGAAPTARAPMAPVQE